MILVVVLLLLVFDILAGFTREELVQDSIFELLISSTHEIFTIILVVLGISLLWRWYQDAIFEVDVLNESIQTLDNKLQFTEQEVAFYKTSLNSLLNSHYKKWSLSKSEEDVCYYLVKGLAIKEIAKLRNTSERTVRNQATIIYDKANVAGRHELAAVFLNSFMTV
tara:strand:- start:6275 stop:6772 length:498 start_codon:yes stop_codon:yes gene_type:complete